MMRDSRKIALIATLAIAALAIGCLIPLTAAGTAPVKEAENGAVEREVADSGSVTAQVESLPGISPVGAVAVDEQAQADLAAVEPRLVDSRPVDNGDGIDARDPDALVIAAPPPAPTNLTLNYDIASHTARLSWNAVSDPNLDRYLVKRWDESDAYMMGWIFQQLENLNPAAAPFVDDIDHQMDLIDQSGWTYTERMNIMAALAADMDALFAIMASTPGAGSLLANALSQATEYRTASTSYNDTISSANSYYVYAVCARNKKYEVSNPSNCKGLYAVFTDYYTPARPTGVTATAYDPGVAIQWSRNTEADLAGYNVYLVQGQSRTKLNQSLVSVGTAFFYDAGVSGAVYGVTAVDVANRESQATTSTAVLAPATVYEEDNPAWQFTGQWVKENYTDSGGDTIRVAQDVGAKASITFTGRMVKVYSAYYWSCGSARFLVDGVVRGTSNLYSPSTGFHMQPFVITGLAPGQHTLTIEALGSGGAEGYNFVNFDSIEVR